MWTQRCKPDVIDKKEVGFVSMETMSHSQTFPEDYDFTNSAPSWIAFILGMSVPPLMIKRLVTKLIEQGVYDYRLKQEN